MVDEKDYRKKDKALYFDQDELNDLEPLQPLPPQRPVYIAINILIRLPQYRQNIIQQLDDEIRPMLAPLLDIQQDLVPGLLQQLPDMLPDQIQPFLETIAINAPRLRQKHSRHDAPPPPPSNPGSPDVTPPNSPRDSLEKGEQEESSDEEQGKWVTYHHARKQEDHGPANHNGRK